MKHEKKVRRRSAITGKFVSEQEVKDHPETTVTETIHMPDKDDLEKPPDDG